MERIYANLMRTYERTGRIGKVKPFDWEHAKKIAHAVALRILHSERKVA